VKHQFLGVFRSTRAFLPHLSQRPEAHIRISLDLSASSRPPGIALFGGEILVRRLF